MLVSKWYEGKVKSKIREIEHSIFLENLNQVRVAFEMSWKGAIQGTEEMGGIILFIIGHMIKYLKYSNSRLVELNGEPSFFLLVIHSLRILCWILRGSQMLHN